MQQPGLEVRMAVRSVQEVQLLGLYSAAHVAQLGSQMPQVPFTKRPLGQTQVPQVRVAAGVHEVQFVAVTSHVRQVELQFSQSRVALRKVPAGQSQVPLVRLWPGGQLVHPDGSRAVEQVRQVGSQAAQMPLVVNTCPGTIQLQLRVAGL